MKHYSSIIIISSISYWVVVNSCCLSRGILTSAVTSLIKQKMSTSLNFTFCLIILFVHFLHSDTALNGGLAEL